MNRGKIIGALVLVVVIGLVAAWQLRAPQQPADPETAATDLPMDAASAGDVDLPAVGQTRSYTLVPEQSEVYWRIYSGGMAAALGHNHVISMVDFSGSVTLTSDLATSSWQLEFPVAALVIDDAAIRARYGEDFESEPSDDDREGTKGNMLREELLNGELYPGISLAGQGITGTLENAILPATVNIVGNEVTLNLPATVEISESSVTVTGELGITHADLGLTPFSMFGGAVAVADEIDLTYRIHAIADSQ